MRLRPALAVAALLLPHPGAAQPAPCTSPDHRSFDFWEGTWEVRLPDGRVAGRNTIRPLLAGCVLHEHYTTPSGFEGESFNVFDVTRRVWHQTWVDNRGTLLTLEGRFDGARMVLEGETANTSGAVARQRITWSRVDGDPDRVRQLWESSGDGGATWSTVFDGLYVRRDEAPAPGTDTDPTPRGVPGAPG